MQHTGKRKQERLLSKEKDRGEKFTIQLQLQQSILSKTIIRKDERRKHNSHANKELTCSRRKSEPIKVCSGMFLFFVSATTKYIIDRSNIMVYKKKTRTRRYTGAEQLVCKH